MSIKITYTQSVTGGNSSYSDANQVTASAKSSCIENVADGEADFDISLAASNAAASDSVQALLLKSTQDVSVEIAKTDNTLLDAIALAAGVPYIWVAGAGVADPTWLNAGDIGKLRVTNASGGTAAVNCDILYDATP